MYGYACVCILTHIQIHTLSHTYVNGYAQMKPYSSGRNFLLLACKSIEETCLFKGYAIFPLKWAC